MMGPPDATDETGGVFTHREPWRHLHLASEQRELPARIQVITVEELLRGERPKTPTLLLPYISAARAPGKAWVQDAMLGDED